MMRFYDTIETPKTGKTYTSLKQFDNTKLNIEVFESTNARVINWFSPCPEGKKRAFDINGFPIFEDIQEVQPTEEQLKSEIDESIENHFNEKAKEWGFNNIDRAVTYVGDEENTEWANEGRMFKLWRTRVWKYIYDELQKVEAGQRPLPTPESVLTEIPTLESVALELGIEA